MTEPPEKFSSLTKDNRKSENVEASVMPSVVIFNIQENPFKPDVPIIHHEIYDRGPLYQKRFVNHQNFEESINYLKSFQSEVPAENQCKLLRIRFTINENFGTFDPEILHELSIIHQNKSIVLLFMEKSGKHFLVYWKMHVMDYFLTLKNLDLLPDLDYKDFYEFIGDFLLNSLRNNHIGLHKDHSSQNNIFNINDLADSQNCNLFQNAAEEGEVNVVKVIIQHNKMDIAKDMPNLPLSPQALAIRNGHLNVLSMLVMADYTYPLFMKINNFPDEMKQFINIGAEMHLAIKCRNKKKIREILSKNPKQKHFYNLDNHSALKAALMLKFFDIYKLLIINGIEFGPHEELFDFLTPREKRNLTEFHFKHTKDLPDSHINILMINTTVSHDDNNHDDKEQFIKKAYGVLNQISSTKVILEAVAASKKFEIVFDFKRDSVHMVDLLADKDTKGIFHSSGKICVGAKQLLDPATEHETFGTLAHEMCHFALHLTYKNLSKPYGIDDKQRIKEFEEISKICEKKKAGDLIEMVYKNYESWAYHAELAVRAPHLIAQYYNQPEKLEKAQEEYPEMFNYYENLVVPDIKEALPRIKEEAEEMSSDKIVLICMIISLFLMGLMGLVLYYNLYTAYYEYVKLSPGQQDVVRNALVRYKNVDVNLWTLYPNNSKIYENLTSEHIKQIFNNEKLDLSHSYFTYLTSTVFLSWANLTKPLKDKFLNSTISFQNEIVKLKDLNVLYPKAFDSLTSDQIISILDEKIPMSIGKMKEMSVKFYIDRKFIPENSIIVQYEYDKIRTKPKLSFSKFYESYPRTKITAELKNRSKIKNSHVGNSIDRINDYGAITALIGHSDFHNSLDNVIKNVEDSRIFVLSSEAGAGKTVTFEHMSIKLKKLYPTRWVSYIDLKDFTQFYQYSQNDVEKLFEKILNLTSVNEFERKIFEEYFKSGKIVIFWNGFDEISPTYNEFIFNLIHWIYKNTNNIQYVCTRPLYSDQLSRGFKKRSWQLVPLNEDDKKEFLRTCFEFHQVSSDKIEEFIEKVEEIIEKLKYDVNSFAYNFNTPLMLKLLAEVHEEENLFKIGHVYGIFEIFVEKKIGMWLEKSTRSHNIAKKLLISGSLRMIFQRYALLNELHVFSSTTLTLKIKKLQIMQKKIMQDLPFEEISRMGILYINGKNKFEFAHKTFTEFFIAQYFIEAIYDVDDDINSDEAELRLEIFFHFAKSYGHTQKIITDFMSSFLEMNKDNEPEIFNSNITALLRTKFKSFFLRLLDNNYPEIFLFLFEFFKKDPDLLADLLHVNQNETFYTAIFNPNHFALFTNPEGIKELAENYLNDENFEKFVNGRDQKGVILFGMHFYGELEIPKVSNSYNSELEALKVTSFNNIFEILNKSEQKELFMTAVNPKIYLFYDKFFNPSDFLEYEQLWIDYENLLTVDELQVLLGNSFIHYFEAFPNDKVGHELFLSLLLRKSAKFLSSSQIFEMFLNKNILHEAHWNSSSFTALWCFISAHTSRQERQQILRQDDFDDKNFYFWSGADDMKNYFSIYEYSYFNYDFTAFKVLHRSIILPSAMTFDFTKTLYQIHFKPKELQEIILSSNDFIYYAIGKAKEEPCRKFAEFLEDVFKGNEELLKELLERKVKRTNLSVLEFVEDFRGLPHYGQDWFANLKIFTDLYDRLKGVQET